MLPSRKRTIIANLIQIVINASDQASSVLTSVSGGLKNVGANITGAGVAMTALAAPLAAFFGTALKQASDQADALSQLNAVIKSTGGAAGVTAESANALSESLSRVTRFSDDAVLSGENMLLTFTNIGKDIFPQATKTALNMSQALGQDLKSSAIQLGKALNDPIKGITALQRVGVTFTQAQKDMIQSLVDAGDIMGAQKVILQELQKEFGGSAEAAGTTFAGKMDILNHKFENFQEDIGNLLIPMLEHGIDVVGGFVDQIASWARENPALVQGIAAVVGGMVVLGPILILVGQTISAIGTIVALVGPAFSALVGPIGLVIAAFVALKAAYDNNFLGFKDFVDGIVTQLPLVAGRVEAELSLIGFYFGYYLGNIWDAVRPGLETVYDWFTQSALPAIVNFVQTVALPVIRLFFEAIQNAWNTISPSLNAFFDWFTNTGMPWVEKMITTRVQPAIASLIQTLQLMWTVVKPYVEAFVNGFSALFGGLNDNVLGPVIKNLNMIQLGLQVAGLLTNPIQLAFAASGVVVGQSHDYPGSYQANTPYLVGTGAQPELFMPSSSGVAIPNADTLGGKSVTLNGDLNLHFNVTGDGLDLNNPDHVEQIGLAVLNAIMA